MAFRDLLFPPRIALGAQRRPGWNTGVVQTAAGFEFRNQNWSRARHTFDVSFSVRTATDYRVIEDHFHSVRGRAYSFPFKDHLGYRVEASRGVLLDDGDSPTLGYQLAARYGTGDSRYDRRITRPKTGTVAIYRLRAGNTVDITGSSTITYTTGMVSIAGGVFLPGDVLSWAGQFFVPCRYDTDDLPGLIVNRHGGPDGELLVTCDSIPIVEDRE